MQFCEKRKKTWKKFYLWNIRGIFSIAENFEDKFAWTRLLIIYVCNYRKIILSQDAATLPAFSRGYIYWLFRAKKVGIQSNVSNGTLNISSVGLVR